MSADKQEVAVRRFRIDDDELLLFQAFQSFLDGTGIVQLCKLFP